MLRQIARIPSGRLLTSGPRRVLEGVSAVPQRERRPGGTKSPIYREYKNLTLLNIDELSAPKLPVTDFSEEQKREIVFKDMNTTETSHTTVLDSMITPSGQSAVGFFARSLMRDLRLVGGFDVLYEKLKIFMETRLFNHAVDLNDLNVLRNLSETPVTRALLETFKAALNQLTVQQRGTTEICDYIKISKIRPFVINNQPYLTAPNTIFNKVVGNNFELQFARLLAESKQIISFAKNPERNPGAFHLEYRTPDGSIENYFPDFIVKESESDIWLIETKGREDLKDPQKWARLKQWCADATVQDGKRNFHPLLVREEQWKKYPPKSFAAMCQVFAEDTL